MRRRHIAPVAVCWLSTDFLDDVDNVSIGSQDVDQLLANLEQNFEKAKLSLKRMASLNTIGCPR